MSKRKEIKKGIELELKEVERKDNRVVLEGYAGAFSLDHYSDRIKPGAFKKTINESRGKWPILKDHNTAIKIGINIEAMEDEKGLYIMEELNLDVEAAREEYSLTKQTLEHGGKSALSIGFIPVKFSFEQEKSDEGSRMVRIIHEVRMFEHSHVAFGANDDAEITVAKWMAENGPEKHDMKSYVDKFLEFMKSLGYKEDVVLKAFTGVKSGDVDPQVLQSASRLLTLLKK